MEPWKASTPFHHLSFPTTEEDLDHKGRTRWRHVAIQTILGHLHFAKQGHDCESFSLLAK